MYQELASTAFLHVAYRPDTGLLIGRWLCSITEAQLREGYETMRQAAVHHQCHRWLMDARRRTDRRLNGPEWVVTTFLPQVQQEMQGPLHVAFLVLPNHLREANEDPENSLSLAGPFQFARFIDEGAANAWLELRHLEAG
jgi:hypothetical protein